MLATWVAALSTSSAPASSCKHNSPASPSWTISTTRFAANTANIYHEVGFADSFANGFAGANGGFLIPSPASRATVTTTMAARVKASTTLLKRQTANEYAGNVTKIIGNHELKFGGGWTS